LRPISRPPRSSLRRRGLLPGRISEAKTASERGPGFFKKVDAKALQVFSRQFATLIEAGVSIVSALSSSASRPRTRSSSRRISDVRVNVESGVILSKALGQHPRIFNRLYVAMVEAGEASGTLRPASSTGSRRRSRRSEDQAQGEGRDDLSNGCAVLCHDRPHRLLLFIVPVLPGSSPSSTAHCRRSRSGSVDASHVCRTTGSSCFDTRPRHLGNRRLEADRSRAAECGTG